MQTQAHNQTQHAPDHTPLVSVIMPVRNEAGFIALSLGAVLRQDYPALEVLIADGMSTDDTRAIICRMDAEYPHIPVHILDNPGQIVPTGLNIATAQARGEIIIRVDGHCEIAPNYVTRCVAHLLADGLDGVGGPIETVGTTGISQTIAAAMSSAFGVGGSAFRTVRERAILADTVPFPAYTRAAIAKAGPYDEELVRNQDDEYNYRLRALGGKLLLAPDVRSRYYSRGTLRKLWQQYYEYGYWKVRVMQKHPGQMQPRQFAPPLFVLAVVSGALLSLLFPPVRGLWLFFLAVYAVANALASLQLAARRGWRHLPTLPLVFLTLHSSYGLGFLVGLVKFRRRWARGSVAPAPSPHG